MENLEFFRDACTTFVSFHQVAVPADLGYRRVPTYAQLGALHARNPHVAHQTRHACIRGHGDVHVFRLAGQRRDPVLGEHLESISGDRVQSSYRNLRVVENLLERTREQKKNVEFRLHSIARVKIQKKRKKKRTVLGMYLTPMLHASQTTL